jgi:hypothetical protein
MLETTERRISASGLVISVGAILFVEFNAVCLVAPKLSMSQATLVGRWTYVEAVSIESQQRSHQLWKASGHMFPTVDSLDGAG